jgi:sortase A
MLAERRPQLVPEVMVRRFLRGAGWVFIGMGAFVLYFLVYQLVGTNAENNHQQANLRQALEQQWTRPGNVATGRKSGPNGTRLTPVALGDAVGIIEIPKIHVQKVIVEGVDRQQLAMGPGHVPKTALPGQPGTVGISGHRTTHGAPFYYLDALAKGDTILLVTRDSIFTYTVTGKTVVDPHQTAVLDPVRGPDGKLKATITLTTCNPRFSARQRLIIFGALSDTRPNNGTVAA